MDEEVRGRGLGPLVEPYFSRLPGRGPPGPMDGYRGHVAMRASFLLDPGIPIFKDFFSTWIAPSIGVIGFASSYEERVPLYLKRRTASPSSGKDPNPKLMHQNLLSKWNQGADAPLLEMRGGGGNG